jgi:hypothetical protein
VISTSSGGTHGSGVGGAGPGRGLPTVIPRRFHVEVSWQGVGAREVHDQGSDGPNGAHKGRGGDLEGMGVRPKPPGCEADLAPYVSGHRIAGFLTPNLVPQSHFQPKPNRAPANETLHSTGRRVESLSCFNPNRRSWCNVGLSGLHATCLY